MPTLTLVLRKLLLAFALLDILMCPLLFVVLTFFPRVLAPLDPIVCPPGTHLDNKVESQTDLRGTITALYAVCVGDRQQVDVTGKVMLILFGLPILGAVLLFVWALVGSDKKPTGSAARVQR